MSDAAEQVSELAELAGGFIHEIKNHLGTLHLNLQLLAEDYRDAPTPRERRAADRVQRLQGECSRLLDLANDFLRYAKPHELQTTPTRLGELVEDMADFFGPTARKAGVELLCHLPADLPAVLLDRDLFRQALLNLLLNAEQAMPQGGTLTLLAVADGDAVRLEVIDTGVGMSPEMVAKAFRPFHTTKPGGTGLGLPLARKIVRAHGGSLDVQSELGQGTRFIVRLPVA